MSESLFILMMPGPGNVWIAHAGALGDVYTFIGGLKGAQTLAQSMQDGMQTVLYNFETMKIFTTREKPEVLYRKLFYATRTLNLMNIEIYTAPERIAWHLAAAGKELADKLPPPPPDVPVPGGGKVPVPAALKSGPVPSNVPVFNNVPPVPPSGGEGGIVQPPSKDATKPSGADSEKPTEVDLPAQGDDGATIRRAAFNSIAENDSLVESPPLAMFRKANIPANLVNAPVRTGPSGGPVSSLALVNNGSMPPIGPTKSKPEIIPVSSLDDASTSSTDSKDTNTATGKSDAASAPTVVALPTPDAPKQDSAGPAATGSPATPSSATPAPAAPAPAAPAPAAPAPAAPAPSAPAPAASAPAAPAPAAPAPAAPAPATPSPAVPSPAVPSPAPVVPTPAAGDNATPSTTPAADSTTPNAAAGTGATVADKDSAATLEFGQEWTNKTNSTFTLDTKTFVPADPAFSSELTSNTLAPTKTQSLIWKSPADSKEIIGLVRWSLSEADGDATFGIRIKEDHSTGTPVTTTRFVQYQVSTKGTTSEEWLVPSNYVVDTAYNFQVKGKNLNYNVTVTPSAKSPSSTAVWDFGATAVIELA